MTYQGLHFDITGDCSSAIAALENVDSAADRLAGRNFAFSVTPEGVDAAIRDVSRVSDAVAAGSSLLSIGADTSGLDDAHGALAELRSGVSGLAGDLGGLSGMSVGVDGAAGIRGLSDELSGLGSALGSTVAGMADFTSAGASFGRTSSDFSRSGSEMRSEIEATTAATNDLTASTRELVSVSSDGQVMNSVRSGGTPGGVFGGSAGGGSFGGGFDNSPGGFDGPPLSGGGGGGGGRGGGGFGSGDDDGGRGLGSFGQLGLMAGAVGAVESLGAGAGGLMAVHAVIEDTPALAKEAETAMNGFKNSIASAGLSAAGEAVPGIQRLGEAMQGLGHEIGSVGAQNMGEVLGDLTSLAGQAQGALHDLEPAIGPGISGLSNVASSLLSGVSTPSSVTSIEDTGKSLSDPGTGEGFKNLISAGSTDAGILGKAGTDLLGTAGQLLGAAPDSFQGPLLGGGVAGLMSRSPLVGGLTTAGLFAAQQEEAAGRPDLVTPTLVGEGIGALIGSLAGPVGTAAGGAVGGLAGGGLAELFHQSEMSGKDDNVVHQLAESTFPSGHDGTNVVHNMMGGVLGALGLHGDQGAKKPQESEQQMMQDFLRAVVVSNGGALNAGVPMIGTEGGGSWTMSGGSGFGGGGGGLSIAGIPLTQGNGGTTLSVGPGGGLTVGGSSPGYGGVGVPGDPANGPGGLIPKGGEGLGVLSASDAAALGLGANVRGSGVGGPDVSPGAGTATGSSVLGAGDPHPTGGWSTDNRVTLSSGWGPGGQFLTGQAPQILSSLTDLRSTASNMFGAMGGLPGGGQDAAALRRDWAASGNMEGAGQEQYGEASRYLGSDIQRGSQSIWDAGPAAVEAYTNSLFDQHPGLQRAPDPTMQGMAGGAGAGAIQTGNTDPFAAPAHGSDSGAYYGWPVNSPQAGIAPGAGRAGAQSSPAARVAGQEPGGYRGALGFGSSGPGGASQLEHLNQMMAQTQAHSMQLNQSSTQLGQTLGQVGQQGQSAAQNLQQDHAQTQSLSSGMQSLSSGAGQASSAMGELGKSAESATGSATALGAAVGGGGGDTGLSGFVNQVGTGISSAASVSGQAIAQSMAQGISSGSGSVASAAGDLGQGAVNAGASALRSKSPSQAFVDLGESTGQGGVIGVNNSMPAMAGAMTAGMGHVLDAARGVADDSGLMVGSTFVESLITGIENQVKTSQFQQLGFGDIKSPLAKAQLGAMGLLGPAGSGAQSYQLSAQEVSFATGVAANQPAPQPITVQSHIYLDGTKVAEIAQRASEHVVAKAFGGFADSYGRQRSA